MSKLIQKILITHYRGFQKEQELILSSKGNITFLVGANNSGKSLIARLFSIFESNDLNFNKNFLFNTAFQDKDFFNFDTDQPISIEITLSLSQIETSTDNDLFNLRNFQEIKMNFEIRKIDSNFLCCLSLNHENIESHHFNVKTNRFEFNENAIETYSMINLDKETIVNICCKLYNLIRSHLLVFDSIRSFDRTIDSSIYKNGAELIQWLKENKNPGQIKRVNQLLSKWLKENFNLEAPSAIKADHTENQLLFTFDNHLELSSQDIGTGYTMLCILLIEIARGVKQLIVIDEIESHLQPGLVRALIKLLKTKEDIQYVISTHSATVIESSTENDFLYRFKKNGTSCEFEGFFRDISTGTSNAKIMREVANELGVIPGDALLANIVIWVEGPSEIFWIRAWIRCYFAKYKSKNPNTPNLIEGLHYTILMTGGNNIVHYSYSEDEILIQDLDLDHKVNILKINPNPFVIIDSDNADPNSKKYMRMTRIAEELKEQNKLHPLLKHFEKSTEITTIPNLWNLKGKELENYSHPNLLKDFYTKLSSTPKSIVSGIKESTDWNVFSSEDGVGTLLKNQGVLNVAEKSGTIKHKSQLARFIYENWKPEHFEDYPSAQRSHKNMLEDLNVNMEKLIKYILLINRLI